MPLPLPLPRSSALAYVSNVSGAFLDKFVHDTSRLPVPSLAGDVKSGHFDTETSPVNRGKYDASSHQLLRAVTYIPCDDRAIKIFSKVHTELEVSTLSFETT